MAKTYQLPLFIPDPSWCVIAYTYSVSDPAISAAIAFNGDPDVREFSFQYQADLDLSGPVSTDYSIIVNGEIGVTEKKTSSE